MELPQVKLFLLAINTKIVLELISILHRFLAKFKGVPEEEELQYTMDKIGENFSNYSAWHNRRYVIVNGRLI